ncbi:MAG: VOC family protein [Acidobacteriota bacterium]
MSRLDHIAYRVKDRNATAKFFQEAFGYKVQQEFTIQFDDGSSAQCIALEPPEKLGPETPWQFALPASSGQPHVLHLAPEIFVSDGGPGSIVHEWVQKRDGIGGIHHLAYQVDSVEATMKEWRDKGWAQFTSHDVHRCDGLTQVFSAPHPLTGVIYEFIERGEYGFCKDNVKALMESTAGL